jgi:hypothetical protein
VAALLLRPANPTRLPLMRATPVATEIPDKSSVTHKRTMSVFTWNLLL